MTAVAGYSDGQTMVLMGDSSASWGDCSVLPLALPKVWIAGAGKGAVPIGGAGSLRLLQLLRYVAEPPVIETTYGQDHVVRGLLGWVKHLREVCREHGSLRIEENVERPLRDSGILVGLGGHWYEIDNAWSIVPHLRPYAAIGCAAVEVMAAIHVQLALAGGRSEDAEPLVVEPKRVLRRALEAAADQNAHVKPPYVYVSGEV